MDIISVIFSGIPTVLDLDLKL